MRDYELAVLYHPDLEVDVSKAEEKISTIIANNEGKITATDNWGKRKLAYPINKLEHAVYVIYTVQVPPTQLQKIEATLNITDEVIRFLLVKVDHKERAKAETARTEKEQKLAQRKAHRSEESDDAEQDKSS